MIPFHGLWFPDRHYKAKKLIDTADWIGYAWPYVKNWGLAVDVGAYIGTMTIKMAEMFDSVMAFEPLPEAYECLKKNVPSNVTTFNLACGATSGPCRYARNPKADYANVREDGKNTANMVRLDDFPLRPDFIKIDAEFTDDEVIKGAWATIAAYHPVLMVEIKGREALFDRLLAPLGYRGVEQTKIDKIYAWT